jgi:gluconolactonase
MNIWCCLEEFFQDAHSWVVQTARNDGVLIGAASLFLNLNQSSRMQAAIVVAGPRQMRPSSVAERSHMPDSGANSNARFGVTVNENLELYGLADACSQVDADTLPMLFMCGEHDTPKRNELSRKKLEAAGV